MFWEQPVRDAGEGLLLSEGRMRCLEDEGERWWWWEIAFGFGEFGEGGRLGLRGCGEGSGGFGEGL